MRDILLKKPFIKYFNTRPGFDDDDEKNVDDNDECGSNYDEDEENKDDNDERGSDDDDDPEED